MHAKEIQQIIESHLHPCTALVEGEDGVHFTATIISPVFAGKSRIEKQKMVYAALGDRIQNGNIHALSIKAFTPDEWQSK